MQKTTTNSKKKNSSPTRINKIRVINSSKPLITLKNVSKSYTFLWKKTVVLENINLCINKGEHLAILGANGAGKTTLAEMICGVKKFSSGHIYYNYYYDDVPSEKMGIQFQSFTYLPGLTVKDNIKFIVEAYSIKIDKLELDRMLKVFNLDKYINFKATKLSGGQQQRLNILLAVISKPEILILDELSTGLDIQIKEIILSFLTEYCKALDATLIFVSHDAAEIESLATRVIFVKNKGIAIDQSKEEIIKQHGSMYNFVKANIFYDTPKIDFEKFIK